MTSVKVATVIGKPRQQVWDAITDHEGMARWSLLSSVTLATEGSPDRNGIGAVRRMRGPGMRIEEEVVAWDPPNSYEYRLNRGAPIRDHRGRVALRDLGASTEVEWSVRFEPIVRGTGWLVGAALRRGLADMLRRLKRNLEGSVMS